jgi:hypothetical protein
MPHNAHPPFTQASRIPMQAVIEFERIFLPLLQEAERVCASEYPDFKFNSGTSSVGGLTEYQGHCAWLECVFPDAADHEADSVAIMVGVKHITTEPKLCEASVGWAHGQHPDHVIELLDHPVALTSHQLQKTATLFPELLHVFRNSLEAWGARASNA